MSDQQEPTEALEATPDTGAPTTEGTPDPFETRYNELRPQYDRTHNELNRYKNDPEFRKELFNELASEQGYEIDPGEPEYEDPYADPSEALQKELAELKSWRDEFTQQTQMEKQAAIAEQYSESKMTDLGLPEVSRGNSEEENQLAETQRNWIVTRAMNMPAIQDQFGNYVPDVESAFQEFRRMVPAAPQVRPETPFVPQGGQENTGVPAWSTDPLERRQQREALMLAKLEQMHQAQQG